MPNWRRRRRQRLVFACVGTALSLGASVSSLAICPQRRATSIFLASESPEPSITSTGSSDDVNIHYSYSFQRHVVVQNGDKVLESFEFLDDARDTFPSAATVSLQESAFIAGGGLEETTAFSIEYDSIVDDSLVDSLIDAMPLQESVAEILRQAVPLDRWAGFTPDRIQSNFQQLELLLESKLQLNSVAAVVVNNFPQVLLYDSRRVEERLDFLLAPLPPMLDDYETDVLDWPLLASQGFGAGWSVKQVRQALQAVPHAVLAMHLEDAFCMRPSLFYFLSALQVSYKHVDECRLELDERGDVYTFAYLYGNLGLEWKQLRVMLQAFPCLAICSTEPTWEMMDTHMRSELTEDSLHYLQRRLQVRPGTVEAMMKTHPRLSSYTVEGKIRPTLDALQAKIGLSSNELRKVILRMPSLIGMSVTESAKGGLTQRINFFCDEVGMTLKELRKAVLKQPALLQYSVDKNLRPKLDFFVKELNVPMKDMSRVIARYPALMGLSLDDTLRPKASALMDACGFLPAELGSIVVTAPNILGLSLKRNLEPKLQYMRHRLGLSKSQLKNVISTTPRVLLQSIKSSLEPKLQMVEEAVRSDGSEQQETMKMVAENPGLLVTTIPVLQQRLDASKEKSIPVQQALRPRKRLVLEIDPVTNKVARVYPSASVAAEEFGVSLPQMYKLCQTGRIWKGKKFIYGTAERHEPAVISSVPSPMNESQSMVGPKRKPLKSKDLKSALEASGYSSSPQTNDDATIRIAVYVSGRVYPPDSNNEVRGIRRAGGMALHFPQINNDFGPELALRLRLAAKRSFGQIMPQQDNGDGGTCFSDGKILIGFPYLRPSRNRCELYACHEAIKVVAQLLKHESTLMSLANETVQVDVYTDSDYAWKLLHNTTRLHTWGSVVNEKDFVYDGPGPASRANPDLLHPLCRTFHRLVNQVDSDGHTPLKLGKQVNVTFHHAAQSMTTLNENAKEAAMWMDQRAKTAIAKT